MFAGGSGSMTTAQKSKAAKEVKEKVDKMKSDLGTAMNKDAENIAILAENWDGKLIIDVAQYASVKASMDLVYAEAADANKSAVIANNSDAMDPFFQVLKVMRTVIDEVI
jgi:hypothetical protein